MRNIIFVKCLKEFYLQVRKVWYAKVKERVRVVSLALWEVYMGTILVLKDGMQMDGGGQGADRLPTVWEATSGRIPIFMDEYSGRGRH
mmetsp:Transcript_39680/g.53975  ORF Transcript_39680/g.53975 Transcript_39680/m.53975 type:complete len:88 (+) Transcript_39680:307-570(+)